MKEDWIETLRPPKTAAAVKKHERYTLEEVRRLVVAGNTERLTHLRDRAAAAFLFRGGMRVGAFVTLPIQAVDLNAEVPSVDQWPSLGVQTEFGKPATTYLLPIEDLLATVKQWDSLVWAELAPEAKWYAPLTRDGMGFAAGYTGSPYRARLFSKGPARRCELAGLPYRSPHSLRHGHAEYALEKCDTVAELKAVSQNLMHKSLVTTDSIYPVLGGAKVADRMAGLGRADGLAPLRQRDLTGDFTWLASHLCVPSCPQDGVAAVFFVCGLTDEVAYAVLSSLYPVDEPRFN